MMHLLRNKLLGESSTRKVAMERQKLIRRVGKRGKCKGQFMNPCGVAVSKAGNCATVYSVPNVKKKRNSESRYKNYYTNKMMWYDYP